MADPIYKIEKNVPFIRGAGAGFDKTQPEYIVMTKMKVGDSFEFPRARANNVHNCRVYLRRMGTGLVFYSPARETFVDYPKMLTGRCWRVPATPVRNYKPRTKKK